MAGRGQRKLFSDEIACICCGRRTKRRLLANFKTAWWLCEKCSYQFSQAKQAELVRWYQEAVERYRKTRDKAYLKFAEDFLRPCVGSRLRETF